MAEGKQIDLDKGEGQILHAMVTNDIYTISPFLDIIFECENKLYFFEDNQYYFTYLESDWVPTEYSESTSSNNLWHYEISAVPAALFYVITKPCTNTLELARAMGLQLSASSSNLKLPCPIINLHAGNIILNMRFYSMENALRNGNFADSIYLYADSEYLHSWTFRTLMNQTATKLEFEPLLDGSNLVIHQDMQLDTIFTTAVQPKIWKQSDYIEKIIHDTFTIKTASKATVFSIYTMSFEKIPELDTGKPYLCFYSKCDMLDPNSHTLAFAHISY